MKRHLRFAIALALALLAAIVLFGFLAIQECFDEPCFRSKRIGAAGYVGVFVILIITSVTLHIRKSDWSIAFAAMAAACPYAFAFATAVVLQF